MKILTALATACFLVLFAPASQAATYRFGHEESIHKIQQTGIRDEDGRPLDLAYKITTSYFFAGVSVHDDGYVLQSRDNWKSYRSLTAGKIAQYQASGLLPNPLPRYSISFFSYLIGYSLWLVLAVVLSLTVWNSIRKPKATPAAGTGTFEPPAAAPPAGSPPAALPSAPPAAASSPGSADSGCLWNVLFWSGFLGFAGALGGSAAEGLWVLTGCASVLYLIEIYLLFWGPSGRRTITIRVITQIFLWVIFITALRH